MIQKSFPILSTSTKQFSSPSITARQLVEDLPCHAKLVTAKQMLEALHLKLPYLVDASVFRELDRIASFLEEDFIQQRTPHHLAKLAYSIALARKSLSQKITLLPLKSSYDIRLSPFSLYFTFGSKPVLGILAHAHLKNKYEAFDEEHILLRIKKFISEAQLVKGSTYMFQTSKSTIKTLYFELDKKSGLPFTSEEIKRLKVLLKQEIELCMEQLVPRVFMTRNEEEVLKNILTLSREIHQVSDIPEVMILLDRQTPQEAIFTVILVRICKNEVPSLVELFAKVQGSFIFFPERCQVVQYLKKKYPVEANVFRIHLPKDPSLLRSDLSINFYLARQKISNLLLEAVGEFRDYNGGMILKQRERLTSLMEICPELSLQNPDFLEDFFHSLQPIEAQTYLSVETIETLFKLLMEAMRFQNTKTSDYFCQFEQKEGRLFFIIRLSDDYLKKTLEQTLLKFNFHHSQVVASILHLQNSTFLGYLITTISPTIQEQVKKSVTEVLTSWKRKIENQRILKLGLEYTVISLDSRIGGDCISSVLIKMLLEGLMRESKEGKIEYGIAKSVEISPDLKTYVFTLRHARWSDGSLVTAFDFEYAWKKVLSPDFKTPFAYLFYPIKNAELAKSGVAPPEAIGIHALDDITLKVELRCPTPYFLELTAHTIYSPVSRLIDGLHPNWPFEEGSGYVCNGAFQLIKNKPQEGYELIKNSLYWDENQIKLEGVHIMKVNRHQAFELFEKNIIHIIGVPLTTWDPLFSISNKDEPVSFLNKGLWWCTFNCQKPPFNNKKMRQAFSMAISREEIASLFNTFPAFSPLPREHSFIKDSPLSHFSPQKAKTLFIEALEEMDLSKEIFPPIKLLYLTGNTGNQIAELIKKYWKDTFAIECTIIPLKWDLLFAKISEGNYDTGCIGWQPWVNDPMYTLNAFREGKEPMNFPKWENRKYQEILYLAERELDLQKREKYYLQAEEILLDEMPISPISPNASPALKKRDLKIKHFSSLPNLKWAHLETHIEQIR
ncbi:MAG: peptide ABC transporter substrate-binding protein [Simkania negevensis]|nr:peptide ABC transporter substrate-binding protein [Simkania negevensis]